ncbi:MAG: hypothetical protein ACFFDT_03545, partial [Candidatus Hodarchaeota archaeon]
MKNGRKTWTVEDSKRVFGIGENFREYHFLDIDDRGHLCLKIFNHSISIKEILQKLHKQLDQLDISNLDQAPSVTLRIPQLVEYQINKIFQSFETAIRDL